MTDIKLIEIFEKDSLDNGRELVAKEAYNRYIGNNKNLTPEKFKEANAFCMGAKFQRELQLKNKNKE